MSIFTSIEGDFERFWANHVQPFVSQDIEPALKSFIQLFDSDFGQQAITAALAAVTTLSTGNAAFGTVATGLANTLITDAKSDALKNGTLTATQILQTVQSALQVAKIANNVVTPADQTAASALPDPALSPTPTAPTA